MLGTHQSEVGVVLARILRVGLSMCGIIRGSLRLGRGASASRPLGLGSGRHLRGKFAYSCLLREIHRRFLFPANATARLLRDG